MTQRNITSKGRSAKAAHTDDPGPEPQREFLLLDGSATGQRAGACRKRRLAVGTARTLITTARDARRDHHVRCSAPPGSGRLGSRHYSWRPWAPHLVQWVRRGGRRAMSGTRKWFTPRATRMIGVNRFAAARLVATTSRPVVIRQASTARGPSDRDRGQLVGRVAMLGGQPSTSFRPARSSEIRRLASTVPCSSMSVRSWWLLRHRLGRSPSRKDDGMTALHTSRRRGRGRASSRRHACAGGVR